MSVFRQKRLLVDPFVNVNDPVEIDLLYHQSVTDVFDQKIPLTKFDAVSERHLTRFFNMYVCMYTTLVTHKYIAQMGCEKLHSLRRCGKKRW